MVPFILGGRKTILVMVKRISVKISRGLKNLRRWKTMCKALEQERIQCLLSGSRASCSHGQKLGMYLYRFIGVFFVNATDYM